MRPASSQVIRPTKHAVAEPDGRADPATTRLEAGTRPLWGLCANARKLPLHSMRWNVWSQKTMCVARLLWQEEIWCQYHRHLFLLSIIHNHGSQLWTSTMKGHRGHGRALGDKEVAASPHLSPQSWGNSSRLGIRRTKIWCSHLLSTTVEAIPAQKEAGRMNWHNKNRGH